jgi:predicted amidohydrolase
MTKQWNEAYLRVASGCPTVTVADVAANVAAIADLYDTAVADACAVLVCPELSLTGYALGDLVLQAGLRDAACAGLQQLAQRTASSQTALVVGLPLAIALSSVSLILKAYFSAGSRSSIVGSANCQPWSAHQAADVMCP